MRIGKALEAPQSRFEQRASAFGVPSRVVMKGRGNLNDALQEGLFRLRRGQPDLFPGLVGLEKVPTVELFDALPELLRCLLMDM